LKRKYFLVGLFLMLVMFLVGCNGNGGSTPPITLNQSPIASFTADPTSGVAPLEVAFNGSNSSDSDGTIVSYVWDFKDGNTGTGQTINHTFSSTGSYNVELTVIDDKGATDSAAKAITVTEPITPPIVTPPIVTPPIVTPPIEQPLVIESFIISDFDGLDYGNIYELANGQIWKQTEYYIWFWYWFYPKVLIWNDGGVYRMKVEGIDHPVMVKRIK